jgi:hypothetical protein
MGNPLKKHLEERFKEFGERVSYDWYGDEGTLFEYVKSEIRKAIEACVPDDKKAGLSKAIEGKIGTRYLLLSGFDKGFNACREEVIKRGKDYLNNQ